MAHLSAPTPPTDPENKAVTWETLMGADAGHFAFDNGALSFKEDPDYEARPDNTYEVTVRARDERGNIGELPVTVTVTNVNERPTITGAAEASIRGRGHALRRYVHRMGPGERHHRLATARWERR